MRKHLNIRVYGVVQGTGYRASARERARHLKLTGFVRNEPDGSVYLEVEGSEADLAKFQKWCSKGPWFARVTKLEAEPGELQHYVGFTVA